RRRRDCIGGATHPPSRGCAEREGTAGRSAAASAPRPPRWSSQPGRSPGRRRARNVRRICAFVSKFYLTTAIDYANGEPHIGHAYEKIGADVIARYRRLRGDEVQFLIGMDEHGQKVAQAASQRGLSPQQQVDEIAERFQAMWTTLGISHTRFMRTTEDGHKNGARALIKRIF